MTDQQDAALRAALIAQFRETLADASDIEIDRIVAECLARMEEKLR
jgi:hypothetical protein